MLLRASPKAVEPVRVARADGVLGVEADGLDAHADAAHGTGPRALPVRCHERDDRQHCDDDCILHVPATFPDPQVSARRARPSILAARSVLRAVS